MKLSDVHFRRWERSLGLTGASALVAGALLAWRSPDALAPAWRFAALSWVGAGLGSLVFIQIYHLTGGAWGGKLRPFLVSGARLLPWTWLLMLPLLLSPAQPFMPGPWWNYASLAAFAFRAVVYGLVFFFVSAASTRAWTREGFAVRLAWTGPLGAIVVLFMNHFVVSDWIAALDPRWHSTAFPVVWLIGQSVVGLAAAVLAALLAGADPAQPLGYHRSLGIDWGTLLFAAAMMWCYVAFAQFLIVWSGNLPEEVSWYARRLTGGWRWVPPVLLALHFIAPLLVLLSRRAKQSRRLLGGIAATLLTAQIAYTAWLILPAFPAAPAALPWLALLLTVGLGGLFANRYLALARKELAP